ncbi:MAG: universal stress protein [Desulfobacteraceae bacterium]|jgi:nucleotide-binding universal stress UspA family protein
MQVIQKILVAVDQSDYSLPLVQYAHQLAHNIGAELILINVYNRRDVSTLQNAINSYDPKLFADIIKENMELRMKALEDLTEGAKARDTVIDKIVRIGVPYQELLEVIEEKKPDLLIMGTKGRSNLADTIVGSCAQKMYRRSPIPMLSLRWKDVSST